MVKSELINKIAEKFPNYTYRDINIAVNKILEDMSAALSQGERIEIRGFGSFSANYLPPRNAHNPKTRERVATDGKYTPHFKPGKALRTRINHNNNEQK